MSEQARLARIERPERRLQFIFGHWLARALLARACSRPVAAVSIEVGADGGPLPEGCGPVALSLAHSGPWVVALVADTAHGAAIGIDLEAELQQRPTAWPARQRPPRDDAVLAAWVLGEARAKAGRVGTEVPAWQARCQTDAPDPATLHLACANVEFSPRVHLVNVVAGSYNAQPMDLYWKQAHA